MENIFTMDEILFALKPISNFKISAAYNALTGFKTIDPKNASFSILINKGLISPIGSPCLGLEKALELTINNRINKGTWK